MEGSNNINSGMMTLSTARRDRETKQIDDSRMVPSQKEVTSWQIDIGKWMETC